MDSDLAWQPSVADVSSTIEEPKVVSVSLPKFCKADFKRLAVSGRKKYTSDFAIQYVMSDCFRVGFTISKKVGNAVKRNKLRRRLRHICRISAPCSGEFVFIAKKGAAELSFESLKQEILLGISLCC